MVAAVLSMPKASRKMTELSGPDRCWLVAGLTNAGMTADEIAERTHCSRRLVMAIRAEDMTQVCRIAQQQVGELDAELSAERSGHSVTRRDLVERTTEVARLRTQLDQTVKKLVAGESVVTCYRNHPLFGDNVYRHGGRVYCRECNRENTIAYRKRKSRRAELERHSVRVSAGVHALAVASGS